MAEPIGVPEFSDKDLQGKTSLGSSLYDKQNYGRAQFAYPNAAGKSSVRDGLVNALLGASQGGQRAAGMAQYGSQGASFLAGLTGAFGATSAEDIMAARQKAQAEAQLAQLEVTPLTADNFPGLIQKHPELDGMPLGLVNKILPLIGKTEGFQRAYALTLLRDRLRDEDMNISPEAAQNIEDAYEGKMPGLAKKITGLRGSIAAMMLPTAEANTVSGSVDLLPPRTKFVTPPGAADAQKMLGRADQFMATIKMAEDALAQVPSGRLAGNAADFWNYATGNLPKVAEARGIIDTMPALAARIIGGDVGNLNENEQARAAKIAPKLSGTMQERAVAIKNMRTLLKDIRDRQAAILSGGAARQEEEPIDLSTPLGVKKAYQRKKITESQARVLVIGLGVPK